MKLYIIILTVSGGCLFAGGGAVILTQMAEGAARSALLGILFGMVLFNLGFYFYFRLRFVRFSNELCRCAEDLMAGRKSAAPPNRETLTSKMAAELEKLERVLRLRAERSESEKNVILESISELTHQIKTPAANIHMYHDMLSDPELEPEAGRRFLEIIRNQLDKLEFLIDTLVKASRLESAMIRLYPENGRLLDTLAEAVGGIAGKAGKKNLDITVDCRSTIQVFHDAKWTAEALENILDNAVKYSYEGGRITVTAEAGEMYTEIRITDEGVGIAPEHLNDIFKRFYREPSLSKTEGLGLGLYLARNIISLQGGYICARPVRGGGTSFSVFLPNREKR